MLGGGGSEEKVGGGGAQGLGGRWGCGVCMFWGAGSSHHVVKGHKTSLDLFCHAVE